MSTNGLGDEVRITMSWEDGSWPHATEIRTLRAVAQYGTIRAAAEALCLSPHTVDFHLDCLRRRSGLRHLPQLVAWGAIQGYLVHIEFTARHAVKKAARSG